MTGGLIYRNCILILIKKKKSSILALFLDFQFWLKVLIVIYKITMPCKEVRETSVPRNRDWNRSKQSNTPRNNGQDRVAFSIMARQDKPPT